MGKKKTDFIEMLEESTSIKIPNVDMNELGTYLGLLHKTLSEDKSTPKGYTDLVELVLSMIHYDELPESFDLAVQDFVDDAFEPYNEDIDDNLTEEDLNSPIGEGERAWTIHETYKLSRVAPWCFDEQGIIVAEEFNDIWEEVYGDYDGDGDPDDILQSASKKSLNKKMKNIKSAKKFTVNKKYDRHAGLSKKQIRDGMIKCPPGTPGEGKIRKKGECSKKVDKQLSRKMSRAAKKGKSKRRLGAKKAAKTRKRLGGRRRAE